jgi:arogenate dehydrogenase (NADP+)
LEKRDEKETTIIRAAAVTQDDGHGHLHRPHIPVTPADMSAFIASSVLARSTANPRASSVSTRVASTTGTRAFAKCHGADSLSARDALGGSSRVPSRTSTPAPSTARFGVRALDAAMPFDNEARAAKRLRKLKIGIVGFGNFGQFLAKRFIDNDHAVIATSRGDYSDAAKKMGAHYFPDPDDFCEQHPDVVIFATSILSTEATINSFPVQRLRRNTLVADVLSVKQFPKQLFLQRLPDDFDIVCLHPMFGPDSGKGTWKNLPLVYDKVRIGEEQPRRERVDNLLSIFEDEGCRMVEMSCEEHDRQAASSQFITHTVGRMLGSMELEDTTINTKGYESLLNLVNNTSNDSFDLYYGLFMYNKNATQELNRLELAFSQVKAQLFDRLHTLIRDDIFDIDGSSPEQLKAAWEKAGETMNERGYKERLIDQVNSTGVIGGSRDEPDRKGAQSEAPSR